MVFISIYESEFLMINLDRLMDLFGVFLLVLIGIELLDTIKVYLREKVVHVEVVVLVAIIALARKVVVLKIEELDGLMIIGIAILVVALSVSYYLIKRAGLMICDMGEFPAWKKKMKPLVSPEGEVISDATEKPGSAKGKLWKGLGDTCWLSLTSVFWKNLPEGTTLL